MNEPWAQEIGRDWQHQQAMEEREQMIIDALLECKRQRVSGDNLRLLCAETGIEWKRIL